MSTLLRQGCSLDAFPPIEDRASLMNLSIPGTRTMPATGTLPFMATSVDASVMKPPPVTVAAPLDVRPFC